MVDLLSFLSTINLGIMTVILVLATYASWLMFGFTKRRFLVSTKPLVRFVIFGFLGFLIHIIGDFLGYFGASSLLTESLILVALTLGLVAMIFFIKVVKVK